MEQQLVGAVVQWQPVVYKPHRKKVRLLVDVLLLELKLVVGMHRKLELMLLVVAVVHHNQEPHFVVAATV
jgi:hypothetical protein